MHSILSQLARECYEAGASLDATLANMPPLLKPTCDEAGNWRYVPAAEIDGPRVPRIVTADERARAAVEGTVADGVAA